MLRRGARAGHDAPKGASDNSPLNAPFRGLRGRIRSPEPATPVAPPVSPLVSRPVSPTPVVDDESLFSRAMAGVNALDRSTRERIEGPTPTADPRPPTPEDAEALAMLSDLVSSATAFAISETREYVEGHVIGLDLRLVRRLRRGDFAWQAQVDLHGMIAAQAHEVVERFVVDGVRRGLRCLLVVHGRGLNSKDQIPVLKEQMSAWLGRGRSGRHVLAFTSARPHDGGAGAMYVLLRRDRKARPMTPTEGAKR